MACKCIGRLCDKFIISTAVAFTGGNLVITIPAGSYNNNGKYCIVVAQAIPATATVNAPVVIQIGTGTQLYLVTRCDCAPLTVCGIKSRRKYSMRVETTPTSGVFRLLGKTCGCCQSEGLRSINGTAPVAEPTTPEATVASIMSLKGGKQ